MVLFLCHVPSVAVGSFILVPWVSQEKVWFSQEKAWFSLFFCAKFHDFPKRHDCWRNQICARSPSPWHPPVPRCRAVQGAVQEPAGCWWFNWIFFGTMWGPPVISWLTKAPATIVISTINHSYWSYKVTYRNKKHIDAGNSEVVITFLRRKLDFTYTKNRCWSILEGE